MAVEVLTEKFQQINELDSAYTRLHISPFNPHLLAALISSSVVSRNVSYHSLVAFPEKSFGYVDLPTMEAEKLQKKLNGSILRGSKMKIEKARPRKEILVGDDVGEERLKKTKDSSKRKRHDDTFPGVELVNRKVKRGWTEAPKRPDKSSKDSRKTTAESKPQKSIYTSGPECLFKTSLPPNRSDAAEAEKSKQRSSKKDVVVHEFAKTTKYATFLKNNDATSSEPASEYVEGKGWLNSEGKVVEPFVGKINKENPKNEDETSSDENRNGEDSTDESDSDVESDEAMATHNYVDDDSPTSSSGDSSENDTDLGSDSSDDDVSESAVRAPKTPPKGSISFAPPPSLSITIPTTTPKDHIHPLEALYKKPALPQQKPDVPSFSFFSEDIDTDTQDNPGPTNPVPMTPFTQMDFEHRGLRSAAPTPDTAHPSRRFSRWPAPTQENDEVEQDSTSPTATPLMTIERDGTDSNNEPNQTSEFQKWFYENRGDNNRAWKKRRKTAAKGKRHRENRRSGGRNI